MQFGGDDQWSNMLGGTELIRKKLGKDAYAMTITLLLNSEGKKMGKTASGAVWLDPHIVPLIRDKGGTVLPKKQTGRAAFRSQHADLTEREYEVLKLVVDGKSNNDIAKILSISEHTAKAHVCNIIQKLVVDDRTQAAVKALKEGIV